MPSVATASILSLSAVFSPPSVVLTSSPAVVSSHFASFHSFVFTFLSFLNSSPSFIISIH
ncbi:hypothetical protein BX666DRAFT_1949303 [Dichotomocladium elegans]|nr:hypothetical protein BX666DRAFT_1949303 [Dichotomocladium elegans]